MSTVCARPSVSLVVPEPKTADWKARTSLAILRFAAESYPKENQKQKIAILLLKKKRKNKPQNAMPFSKAQGLKNHQKGQGSVALTFHRCAGRPPEDGGRWGLVSGRFG